MNMIDAHIHLDLYPKAQQKAIINDMAANDGDRLIAVSMHLASCKKVIKLQQNHPRLVIPAFGFHPEQKLPGGAELDALFAWMLKHRMEMAAIGEVGLPYYMRHEAQERGEYLDEKPYIDLLERFVALAAKLNKPIVLHAVYEDAAVACDLLEQYKVTQAHFHWFKGSAETVERMIANGYYISITPDITYEAEIQQLAALYPLSQLMVETDGPWPFEGAFSGQMTHPRMMRESIAQIAAIKGTTPAETDKAVYQNALKFYNII
jgi:TatD DNase family protein